jgi:DNA-binding response OmpR family regulator
VRAPKVLIVDDDKESRDLLCEVLQSNGYAVQAVSDGVAARAELRRGDGYLVVIADLRMPNETGLELLRNLRQEESKQAIILMSSFISGAERKLARELGAHALLEKPFRLTDLLRIVGELACAKPVAILP